MVYGLQCWSDRVRGVTDLATRLGAHRVIEPKGTLPQAAERLDCSAPLHDSELVLDVELLNLDATSHRQIRRACGGDPHRMAGTIADIVAQRGKMHNPQTGSGGILVGCAAQIGPRFASGGLAIGDRVVPLVSLTLVPLTLDAVGPVDAASPQVPVRGRAILAAGMPWVRMPTDLPQALVIAALDVYGAASHTRALASAGARVVILGAGRAGLLAAAAAREATRRAETIIVVDVRPSALANVSAGVPGVTTVLADASDPLATEAALAAVDGGAADLTVVVVNQRGCEMSAVLATASDGVVLFFSMATTFTAAALGAEGVASTARLVVGNGYAPDHGNYALDLLRADERLRASFAQLG
jgi:L-erythro-3,5-diaminohexanoate dehydrogenase